LASALDQLVHFEKLSQKLDNAERENASLKIELDSLARKLNIEKEAADEGVLTLSYIFWKPF
jgi:regulator of replication initiation timing